MAKERSTKPYLIRAICEWCGDSGLTAYLSVKVDANTRVPKEHVKNGEIVLNISPDAAHRLTIGDDIIQFAARFSGVSRECSIPVAAVQGIFAKENSQGLFFQPEPATAAPADSAPTPPPAPGGKPRLQIVK
jgi:stringent starvation protein B